MLGAATIAHEFPLLVAIANELGEANRGNEMVVLRDARRILKDAFCSLDRASNIGGTVRFKRCFAAARVATRGGD